MAQQNATPDDPDDDRPLDASDLSEGDVVELSFQNYGNARYRVEGEWDDEDTTDLEQYGRPEEDAVGMFPGLKATRVWTENAGDYRDFPRLRATLYLDADTHTAGLVNNYPENEDGESEDKGYETILVQRAEVVEVEDRWTVEGDLSTGRAGHVRRVVREAIENEPLLSTIEAEEWTLKDADHSGTGCLGGDLGVTVYCSAAMDLRVREAFESYLYENLNDNVWFECERSTEWTFLYDDENGTHALR